MTKPNLAKDNYYNDAQTWARDRLDMSTRSRRVAWTVASAAGAVAVIEAFALLALTPLKTVVPVTLLVDRHTGYVETLKDLQPGQITADGALTQSFLVQYVLAREGFDRSDIQQAYKKVALWSSQSARSTYLNLMRAENPDNPLNLYPGSTTIEAQIASVSPLSAQTTMVRFTITRIENGSPAARPENYVAIVQYRFSGEPMKAEDRYINPLGFQVLSYKKTAETLAQPVVMDLPIPAHTPTEPLPGSEGSQ